MGVAGSRIINRSRCLGPRLPHDMAFTERYTILNDLPLFWDPSLLDKGVHRARLHRDLPSRFAIVPRHGGEVRWFEASPTYVLHFINAYEDGEEIVLDGFHQANPVPRARPEDGPWGPLLRSLDMRELGTRAHRWRFHLGTGATREEFLDDRCTEFPMIHAGRSGLPYRYTYAMTNRPGWFLFDGIVKHDWAGGASQAYRFPDGVFASESPFAPRSGATDEDDGYLVTLITDMANDRSECQIFRAQDLARGPIARLALPERICSGTHSCWAGGYPPSFRE
jgi:carotenoid cleavage dioxygenase-like enzyme